MCPFNCQYSTFSNLQLLFPNSTQHSQSYLSSSIEAIQDQLRQAHEAHDTTKQELVKANEEVHTVKQECRKRRKQMTAQQSIMGLGPNGYHKVGG